MIRTQSVARPETSDSAAPQRPPPLDVREPDPAGEGRAEVLAAGRPARRVGGIALALAAAGLAYASLLAPLPETAVPLVWPASGVLAGLMLGRPARERRRLLALAGVGIAVAYVVHGTDPALAVWFALACAAEAAVVRALLRVRRGERLPTLLDEGDVSVTILAVALGSCASAAGYAAAAVVAGTGDPTLWFVAVWGAHAASLTVLLPLFMRRAVTCPPTRWGERAMQWVLVLGTTTVVAGTDHAPPLLFAVMPMIAWLGYRSTLRQASWVLICAGVITTVMTASGAGPVAALGEHYDLAPELVAGYLQLFLLGGGLILLPLTVSVAQQRRAALEAEAGRDTLDRMLASATATSIVALDADGRVVVFNTGAESMLGYPAAEVLDGPADRFHPSGELLRLAGELGTVPDFARICAAIAASEDPRRLLTFVRRDGGTGTMLMSVAPLPAGPGGGGGFLCTAEDVTEREQAQAALVATLEHREAAVARLEELDRIRTDFVSTVSHELRTPITSIIGFSELLQDCEAEELPDDHALAVDRISRNGRRLLRLIEDLLTATQVQTAELVAIKESCDLRAPVSGAVDAASDVVTGRDVRLHVDLPTCPVPFTGDPAHLERMVLNLLTNAIKFTPDGGTVSVAMTADPDGIRVVVQDTGVGIPEDEQDRLFTRFFRSSTASRLAIQGTGLGLTIVQAIAELHGGEVDVASAAGEGTTVTVRLPCDQPPRRAAGG